MVITTEDVAHMLYQSVEVRTTVKQSRDYAGYLKAFDPVSRSIILCQIEDKIVVENVIILGQHIARVDPLDAPNTLSTIDVQGIIESDTLDRLKKIPFFRHDYIEVSLTEEELQDRRRDISDWLVKNRIPVKVDTSSGDIIIADSVRVKAPYQHTSDYTCPSGTVLKRLKHLVDSRPVDKSDLKKSDSNSENQVIQETAKH